MVTTMTTEKPKIGAMTADVGHPDDKQETKVAVVKGHDGKPLNLQNRVGRYWLGWDPRNIFLLTKALRENVLSKPTEDEKDLLIADNIIHGNHTDGGVAENYLMQKLHSHQLQRDEIADLRTKKTKVIVNTGDRGIEINMPPGSGSTFLIMPGKGTHKENQLEEGGAHVLDGYTEQFINPEKIRAEGLKIVDYNPDNPAHNPPQRGRTGRHLGYDVGEKRVPNRELGVDRETDRFVQREKENPLNTPENIEKLQEAMGG